MPVGGAYAGMAAARGGAALAGMLNALGVSGLDAATGGGVAARQGGGGGGGGGGELSTLVKDIWARISTLLLSSASSNPLALFILLLISSLGLACLIALLLDLHDRQHPRRPPSSLMTPTTTVREYTSISSDEGRRIYGNTRIYVDGVFDLVHVGHAHALFQAARCYPDCEIIVGVNDDDDVAAAKGSRPVMTQAERADVLREIRWVRVLPLHLHSIPFSCALYSHLAVCIYTVMRVCVCVCVCVDGWVTG